MTRDEFDEWVSDMQHKLESCFASEQVWELPRDYSRDSLLAVEKALLARFRNKDEVIAPGGRREFLDCAVRHIGETYRREFGGRWTFDEPPTSPPFGPRVYLHDADYSVAPLFLITLLVDRRTGVELATAWDREVHERDVRRGVKPRWDEGT